MINVPHAFTPEFPSDETASTPCKVPVIVNAYDAYMCGANSFDIAVHVESVFDKIAEMTWCHQSQIVEWIPWVGRHNMKAPASFQEWSTVLNTNHAVEVFTVTAWGEIAEYKQVLADFPNVSKEWSNLSALEQKLRRWGGD